MKCPSCEEGTIEQIVVEEYIAELRGIVFLVEDAKIGKCDTCEEKIYHAKEIKRWEKLLDGKRIK